MIKKILLGYTLLSNLSYLSAESIGFLYAHGLGRSSTDVHFYNCSKWNIIHGPLWTFNFPDVIPPGAFNPSKVTLGQHEDCKSLHANHNKFVTSNDITEIVLIGSSRGAATIINYLGLYEPTNVKAAVLESPFDSVENVIRHRLEQMNIAWIPGTVKFVHFCVGSYLMYPSYSINGPQPLESVKNISNDIPLLFIHSSDDKVTPVWGTQQLIYQAVQRGNNNIYFLEIPSAVHGKYQLSPHGEQYHDIVHAFFKKYNIPHNKEAALRGQEYLEACHVKLP